MKFPTLSKRFWVSFTTLLVIGLFFFYYLFVYVQKREEILREEKYRALARYGQNMLKIKNDYEKAIERVWSDSAVIWTRLRREFRGERITSSVSRDSTYERVSEIKKIVEQRAESSKEGCCCCEGNQLTKRLDEIKSKIKKQQNTVVKTNYSKEFISKFGVEVKERFRTEGLGNIVMYEGFRTPKQFDSLMHHHFDQIYFTLSEPVPPSAALIPLFSIPAQKFVYRPDQFDEFFVIKKMDERYHLKENGDGQLADEIFQTFQNRIDLCNIDSFMTTRKGLLTTRFEEIELADTKYKLFSHSIKFKTDENWILCGLVKTTNYNSEVRSVDPFVITSAILIVLFLIVSMPLLKLLLMNTYDRLGIVNVWFTGFSVVGGTAIFFLLIWSASDYLRSNVELDDELRALSDSIKNEFQTELGKINAQLEYFKTREAELVDRTLNANRQMKSYVVGNYLKKFPESWKEPYPYFNYVMWLTEGGECAFTITTKNRDSVYRMPVLDERKYFSRAKNDSLWYLPGDPQHQKTFALQSIQSWTDHTVEVGFGIKSESDKPGRRVLALSTRLHSITDPVLPPGYSFCIVDRSGEVWFHSNSKKNHQENIFHEINPGAPLSVAIGGRVNGFFSGQYASNRSRIYAQPIDNVPLFLVVFRDQNFQRTPIILAMFFAFTLVAILFLIQGIQLLILYVTQYQSTKLGETRFWLKVLSPNPDDPDRYGTAFIAHIGLLIASLIFYFLAPLSATIGFITLPLMLMVFHQWLDTRDSIAFTVFSILLIALLNLIAFQYLDLKSMILPILQQATFGLVLISSVILFSKLRSPENNSEERKKFWELYPANYHSYLLFWLILISLVPVTWFYKMAYEQESIIWTKYQQLVTSEARDNRVRILNNEIKSLDTPWLRKYPDAVGNYVKDVKTLEKNAIEGGGHLYEFLLTSLARFPYPIGNSIEAVVDKSLDGRWNWKTTNEATQIEYFPDFYGSQVKYSSLINTFNPFHSYPLLIMLLLAGSIYIMYRVIRFSVKSIFGVGSITRVNKSSTEELLETIRKSKRIFIVGLPGSDKNRILGDTSLAGAVIFKNEAIEHRWPEDRFVVPDFEFGINDHDFNQKRLEHLYALTKGGYQIIIFSCVHPSVVLEMYRKKIRDGAGDDKEDPSGKNKIMEYKIALRKWKNLLNDFEVHYQSITPNTKIDFRVLKYVNEELNSCLYLQKISIGTHRKSTVEDEEDFIIEVMDAATPYYSGLWNAFSEEEKLFLFDLARDGFANLKNHQVMRVLMQKGVVVCKDARLAIMNRSFANFILDTFREDEEIAITKTARKKSTWYSLQIILVLVVVGILVFIALAQRNMMNNLNAFVLALTSALGLLAKFSGVLSSAKAKD